MTPIASNPVAVKDFLKDRFLQIWLGAIVILMAIGLFMGGGGPLHFDAKGQAIGRDYINIWTASNMMREGNGDTIWRVPAFQHYIETQVRPDYERQNWSYPPTLQFFIVPFAYVPYLIGLVLWLMITAIPLMMAVRGYGWGWPIVLLLILSPAAIWNMGTGQNGFLTAGLLALGLQTRKTNPWMSAVSFALLTFKPHLGVLIPILLVIEKNWSLIIKTGILAVGLVLLSILVFGMVGWEAYFTSVKDYQWWVVSQWEGFVMYLMTTPWMAARLQGVQEISTLWMIQAPFTLAALIFSIRAFLKGSEAAKLATLMLSTFILFPYAFVYDMVAYQMALLIWWCCGKQMPNPLLRVGFWLWPFLMFPLAYYGYQLTPLIILILLLLVAIKPKESTNPAV